MTYGWAWPRAGGKEEGGSWPQNTQAPWKGSGSFFLSGMHPPPQQRPHAHSSLRSDTQTGPGVLDLGGPRAGGRMQGVPSGIPKGEATLVPLSLCCFAAKAGQL